MSNQSGSFKRSIEYALSGIRHGFVHERNLKIEFWITNVVLGAELIVRPPFAAVAETLLGISLVLAAELFNTAIECIVGEMAGDKWSLEAKLSKDTAAGAVVMIALGTIGIGLSAMFAAKPWQMNLLSHRHAGGAVLALSGLLLLWWLRFSKDTAARSRRVESIEGKEL